MSTYSAPIPLGDYNRAVFFKIIINFNCTIQSYFYLFYQLCFMFSSTHTIFILFKKHLLLIQNI
eukprot:UN06381